MDVQENIISVCSYFFEVLVKKFLELEKEISKNSGVLSIFKKINFKDRATSFRGLMERAIEAEESLPQNEDINSEYELYSLASKLTECFALYINMLEAQVNINVQLDQKANGKKYSLGDYTKNLKSFEMWRKSLETELPKLNALYTRVHSKADKQKLRIKETVDEKQLAGTVISKYLQETNDNFNKIIEFLHSNFNPDDLEPKEWIQYDCFLCGLALDSMALFNLLDIQLANRIYHYISVEKFSEIEDKDQVEYSLSEVSEYKRLYINDYMIDL